MTIQRTNPAIVNAVAYDLNPPLSRSATGYGGKLPTPYRLRYGNRWRRVYVACYGNAGSSYVIDRGLSLYLDIDTEYAMSEGLPSERLGL